MASYKLGIVDGMDKVAKSKLLRPLLFLRHPEAWGAMSGAATGALIASEDDRMGGAIRGALIGAGIGHLRRQAKLRRWATKKPRTGGVGGPGSPVAVPGSVHVLV